MLNEITGSMPAHEPRITAWKTLEDLDITAGAGTFKTKWYRKPASKNILVHFTSAHPSGTKKAIIRNMVHTASKVSSGDEEKAESVKKALFIARAKEPVVIYTKLAVENNAQMPVKILKLEGNQIRNAQLRDIDGETLGSESRGASVKKTGKQKGIGNDRKRDTLP
ncbi:hypothetical protein OSTOST_01426 [Ostertagia ostertagi]